MVGDAGLSYAANYEGGRMVYCPVCKEFRASRAAYNGIQSYQRCCCIRKAIGKHLQTRHQLVALEEREKELCRNSRQTKIGLNIARSVLQTLREGSSYVQFEMKLRDLHLARLDIGSINNLREFIKKVV
jgi:hypothetical protein